jgi:hypothetical protein
MSIAAFEDLDEEDEVDELAGLLVVGVVAVVVELEPVVVVVPEVVEAAGAPVPDAVVFKQLVLLPARTVNAAVCPVTPLLSLTVAPRLVPAASFTAVQVNEVPFTCPKLIRGFPLGVAPGKMLRKYGAVPPLQVN